MFVFANPTAINNLTNFLIFSMFIISFPLLYYYYIIVSLVSQYFFLFFLKIFLVAGTSVPSTLLLYHVRASKSTLFFQFLQLFH